MERIIKLFSVLSDKTRLQIYLLLLESELCVCELGGILNMEQSRISHGLRALREAGLIKNYRVKLNIAGAVRACFAPDGHGVCFLLIIDN